MPLELQSSITGSILGTAVGDAIGLPYEGLSPQRAERMLGAPDRYRLFLKFGMVSDDTEHSCMVAQALIVSGGDVTIFQRQLARRLRFWFLGLPAGIGLATLRSIIKLWVGFSPDNSGVFSAGNGPAMRVALLGAAMADEGKMREFVSASTRITHTDPKAEYGALAIALAAGISAREIDVSARDYLKRLTSLLPTDADEFLHLINQVSSSIEKGESTMVYAASIGQGKGVSGYVYQSVPVALHAWLSHPRDFRAAIIAAIECGGDTDTVAAMVGGIIGAGVGKEGIPEAWLEQLIEWPRSVLWMQSLGEKLHQSLVSDKNTASPRLPVTGTLLRNFLFLLIVLCHGFRRLLPPY